MSNYHRSYVYGGCYFFTLVTWQRFPYFADETNIKHLRSAFRHVKQQHPFNIEAIVVLPDHLHTIWRLPEDSTNYALRWRLIKHYVATKIETWRNHRQEKRVWQRRYWEHTIHSKKDWHNHMDYIHYNPVKHGYVKHPCEWAYSSFKLALKRGWYDTDWGSIEPDNIRAIVRE
ncbi:MAG TPA: transposase [Gammaproteobacteria bacterium]